MKLVAVGRRCPSVGLSEDSRFHNYDRGNNHLLKPILYQEH